VTGIVIGVIVGLGLICVIAYVAFSASDWEHEQEQNRKRREAYHTQMLRDVAEERAYFPHYFADTWRPGIKSPDNKKVDNG
jgi:hypothetical protein